LIISEFRDEQERPYLMGTNNSQRENLYVKLGFSGHVRLFVRDWHTDGEQERLTVPGDALSVYDQTYAPGQGEIFRVESGTGKAG